MDTMVAMTSPWWSWLRPPVLNSPRLACPGSYIGPYSLFEQITVRVSTMSGIKTTLFWWDMASTLGKTSYRASKM